LEVKKGKYDGEPSIYYTYIIMCQDKSYYTGYCSDIEKRVKAHESGRGSKYIKSRGFGALVYSEEFETRREAMKREVAIKSMTRKKKKELIVKGS
jgi:putative endonuclease